MPTTPTASLRKAAILVVSLDPALSKQLLMSLPPADAKRVQELAASLTDIDPYEQEAIVDDFQRRLSRKPQESAPAIGVELEATLANRIDRSDYDTQAVEKALPAGSPGPLETLSAADATFIHSMLVQEHPQTIALVISRMDSQQAAEVLAQFPQAEQASILQRLAQLDPADETTIQVVEAQVAEWITQERQRKRRMAAGLDLVERIKSKTPISSGHRGLREMTGEGAVLSAKMGRQSVAAVRPDLVTRTAKGDPLDTPKGTIPSSAAYEPSTRLSPRMQRPSAGHPGITSSARISNQPHANATETTIHPFSHYSSEQCVAALEELDTRVLHATLATCPPQVVSLALAGSSNKLLKRVLRKLPARAAREFRQSLRDMGPTRLSDILSAQQRVLYLASQRNQT